MGVTIFFKGSLQDKQTINSLIDELADISKIMNWKYSVIDEDWSQPSTAKLIGNEIIGYLAIKGIDIVVHPHAESLSVYFDSAGNLTTPVNKAFTNMGESGFEGSFIKTQFAPPDIHIAVINLLRYLKKKYVTDMHVFDEGGYWDTNNKELLMQKMNIINKGLDVLEDALSKMDLSEEKINTADELVKILEERLKKLFGKGNK